VSANGTGVRERDYLIPSVARDLGSMFREPVRYVYILASQSRVLYTGTTSDLRRRVYQHKHGLIPGFTSQYAVNRLVYFESTSHIRAAVERERQIKAWRREKKLRLIESVNAGWLDLSTGWFSETVGRGPSPAPSLREGYGSG
jgi:putative endonuclease